MNRNRRDPSRATFGKAYRYRITGNVPDDITRWSQGIVIVMDSWQQGLLRMMYATGAATWPRPPRIRRPRRYTGGLVGTAVTPSGAYCPCGAPFTRTGALCRNCCAADEPGPELRGMSGGPVVYTDWNHE